MNDRFIWKAEYFYTAKEVEAYISSIKKSLIGKPIDSIMVLGEIYHSFGFDDEGLRWMLSYENNGEWELYDDDVFVDDDGSETMLISMSDDVLVEKVSLELDEPIALCFGDTHFEIEYTEYSNAQIGVNTFSFNEQSYYGFLWRDVNRYYNKNIIGQRLSDIKIVHTNIIEPMAYTSGFREDGEDMYKEIIFIFENNHALEISAYIDYMSIIERNLKEINAINNL